MAERAARGIQAGNVCVNDVYYDLTLPHGGTKQSGWGRNLGGTGFFEYIQPKHIGIGFEKSPVSGWFGIS